MCVVLSASDIHPGHPHVSGVATNRTVEAGQSVHISCAANGDAPLHFDWFKDGFPLPTSHHLHPNHERKNLLGESHVKGGAARREPPAFALMPCKYGCFFCRD